MRKERERERERGREVGGREIEWCISRAEM